MTYLNSYEDFRRLGFSRLLSAPDGMGQVRRFVRAQLDDILSDPDRRPEESKGRSTNRHPQTASKHPLE